VRAPRSIAALAALALAVGAPALAAPEPRDVSDLLRPLRERRDVPALAAALVVGDRLAAVGADGVRRRGSPERVTTADRFHLGSCTKAMTATLVALLVEEGVLSWDRPVAPFPGVETADPGWKRATLEHLVTHRAGAPAELDAGGLWGRLWAHPGTPREQRRSLVEGVLSRPPVHAPGSKTLYANSGYAIAGATAEEAAGRAWEDLLRERVFGPLGMASAGYRAPGDPDSLGEPRGHRGDGAPVEPGPGSDNPDAIGPAGTVHCSVADWAKFVTLHLRGEERGGLGLPASAFRRLHAAPPGSDHAMGWIVAERSWGGGRVLTHAGSNTVWYAVVWMAPKKGFAVLAACNQGGEAGAMACDDAASALIRLAR
jgi:CubicO group peptidase (beta-lactamase class C family)